MINPMGRYWRGWRESNSRPTAERSGGQKHLLGRGIRKERVREISLHLPPRFRGPRRAIWPKSLERLPLFVPSLLCNIPLAVSETQLHSATLSGINFVGSEPATVAVENIAEQRGIPRVEQRSLAHCLQNMWLKASALGLGLQILSITAQLDNDKEFCDLIKIPIGEFALDGCLIGQPAMKPSLPKRPELSQIMQWLS